MTPATAQPFPSTGTARNASLPCVRARKPTAPHLLPTALQPTRNLLWPPFLPSVHARLGVLCSVFPMHPDPSPRSGPSSAWDSGLGKSNVGPPPWLQPAWGKDSPGGWGTRARPRPPRPSTPLPRGLHPGPSARGLPPSSGSSSDRATPSCPELCPPPLQVAPCPLSGPHPGVSPIIPLLTPPDLQQKTPSLLFESEGPRKSCPAFSSGPASPVSLSGAPPPTGAPTATKDLTSLRLVVGAQTSSGVAPCGHAPSRPSQVLAFSVLLS